MIPAVGAPDPKGQTRKRSDKARTTRDAPEPAAEASDLLAAAAKELGEASQVEPLSESSSSADASPEPAGEKGRIPCPLCGTEGALSVSPRHSERYQTCPECAGHGVVLSGSLVEEAFMLPCESCSAKGYVANPDYRTLMEASGSVPFPNPSPPAPPAPGMEWDPQLGMWAYPRLPSAA